MLYNNAMHHQTYPAGYGHEYGMPSSGHQIHHQGLVETIQHCESVCEHMITHIKMHYDLQMRIRQLVLLRDCADICGLTANYVARNSMFAKQTAQLCGHRSTKKSRLETFLYSCILF